MAYNPRPKREEYAVKPEEPIPDRITSIVCRLCLKNSDESFTKFENVFHMVLGIAFGAEDPTDGEKVCPQCSDQLHSAWELHKRIQFTDAIWRTFRKQLNHHHNEPLDQFVLDDEVTLNCHVCPSEAAFTYDSLLGHIATVHGSDHLSECKFCDTLLDCQAVSNLDVQAEISIATTTASSDVVEDIVSSPSVRKTRKRKSSPVKPVSIIKSEKILKTPPVIPLHGCPKCDKTYSRRDKLKDHLIKHHKISTLPKNTLIPPENIRSSLKLKQNSSNSPSKRRLLACRECDASFDNWIEYKAHMKLTHDVLEIIHELPSPVIVTPLDDSFNANQKPFSCHICEDNISYHRCDRLVRHLRQKHKIVLLRKTSADPDRCVCKICGKVLAVAKSLWRHMEMCHNVSRDEARRPVNDEPKAHFVCPTCGKTFRVPITFDLHLLEHSPLPFTCTICEVAAFKTRGERKDHELNCFLVSATSNVQYQCQACGPGSVSIINGLAELQTHRKSCHGGEDNKMTTISYKCIQCPLRSFSELTAIIEHLNEHPSVSCGACEKTYTGTAQLKAHHTKSHNQKHSLVCTECGQTLSRPDKLIEHMWTHTGFACNPCNLVFATRKEAQKHRKEEHYNIEGGTGGGGGGGGRVRVMVMTKSEEEQDEEEVEYVIEEGVE